MEGGGIKPSAAFCVCMADEMVDKETSVSGEKCPTCGAMFEDGADLSLHWESEHKASMSRRLSKELRDGFMGR